MVSSVTTAPYSYLSQLQGATPAPIAPAATAASTSSGSGSSSAAGASATSTAQSLVSSLLGNNESAFTPEILSLLQQNSSGSFDPITTLLGGSSTNNALTSEYANLYASVEAASITQSKNDTTPQQTASSGSGSATASATTSPVENLINALTQASVAYNQTNQQNAQAVINANSYGPDGITPLGTSS